MFSYQFAEVQSLLGSSEEILFPLLKKLFVSVTQKRNLTVGIIKLVQTI